MANKVRVDNAAGVTFYPEAYCEGPDDETTCSFRVGPSPATREKAKRHAKANPGHSVFVDVVKRDIYVGRVVE